MPQGSKPVCFPLYCTLLLSYAAAIHWTLLAAEGFLFLIGSRLIWFVFILTFFHFLSLHFEIYFQDKQYFTLILLKFSVYYYSCSIWFTMEILKLFFSHHHLLIIFKFESPISERAFHNNSKTSFFILQYACFSPVISYNPLTFD